MASLVRLVAVIASALVVLSFLAFASDQAGRGSKEQEAKLGRELGEPAPNPNTERERERQHGAVREKIDDANDVLVAPFSGVINSHDLWVQRIVTGLLALLTYGLGLTLLANFLPGRGQGASDWRTAGT
jgi:hypothetical protein